MFSSRNRISGDAFWEKVTGAGRKAGSEVLEAALALWYVMRSESTPAWAKALIAGAIAYFVSPIDAVPDFLPGGFVDDLGAMAVVLLRVKAYRTEEIDRKVEENLPDWCKEGKEPEEPGKEEAPAEKEPDPQATAEPDPKHEEVPVADPTDMGTGDEGRDNQVEGAAGL